MDWKIELIPINVSDVDAAVEFYGTKVDGAATADRRPSRGCGSCR